MQDQYAELMEGSESSPSEQARHSPSLEMVFQIGRVLGAALDQAFQSSDGRG